MNTTIVRKEKSITQNKEHFSSQQYVNNLINFSSPKPKQSTANSSLTENRLKTLLNALPAGVVVVDGHGIVNECNPAAIALLGEPLLGESWREVISQSFRSVHSGQDVITVNNRIVNISTCPLGEGFPGQIILLQDVTNDRQMQLQLEQHKRLATMGQMAAQLAHQIRTPIASALLYASHLKKSNLSEVHRIKFADKILNRIQNLEKLIKDMLLFSKNGMEQVDQIKVIELFEMVKQELPVNEAITSNIHEKLQGDKYILGNSHLLLSSICNLIDNALQVTNINHPEVNFEVISKIRGMVDFIIRDNGSGIDNAIKNKIFDPFFTTKDSGTGLGLAVVKAIAQAHEGNVWIDKTSEEGTTFVIRLPLHTS
ncbi:MAG: PAS domain-containing protein [Gammaproteobacteria bacterium]|nr:PAS domain-containing protein [Gammaproteobacteria bacterium]